MDELPRRGEGEYACWGDVTNLEGSPTVTQLQQVLAVVIVIAMGMKYLGRFSTRRILKQIGA